MRLRGKGMPMLRSREVGDMFIELAVETPVNLTARQRELLREFELLSADNNPEGSSFFTKVRNFWDGMKGCGPPRPALCAGGVLHPSGPPRRIFVNR